MDIMKGKKTMLMMLIIMLVIVASGCGSGSDADQQQNVTQDVQNADGSSEPEVGQSQTYYCSDSDGGKIYDEQGSVTGEINGLKFKLTDSCDDQNTLYEWFCLNGQAKKQEFGCYCTDGACREAPEPEAKGTLNVAANVVADVFVGDKNMGTTPLVAELDPGFYSVKLIATGFRDSQKNVDIVSEQETKIDAVLEKVSPEDAGATLKVNATMVTGKRSIINVEAYNPAGIDEIVLYTNTKSIPTFRNSCNFDTKCDWDQQVIRFTSGVYTYIVVMIDANNQSMERSVQVIST